MSTTPVAADLIMLNANVLTIDQSRPRAQAVAIGGGRVLAVGSNDELRDWVNPAVAVRDLAGQTLLPGFYDSHNHMLLTGLNLAAVDLSGAKSVADVVRVMGGRAASAPPGQWVLSSARWHESQLAEGRFPLPQELDRVSAGHPMLLQRGGHNVVANSQALELANGFLKYIGPDRTRDIEPLRMYLARSDQPVGGGSDSPVTPYEPLLGVWSAVTRQTHLAGVQGPEWRIGAEEALRMYTLGSAYAAFEEDQKGSISPGKHADLVVLDADPCAVEPDAIREIRVLLTLVDGRPAFEA